MNWSLVMHWSGNMMGSLVMNWGSNVMRCLVVSWDCVVQNWRFQMSILVMDWGNMWSFVVNWCLMVHWSSVMRSLMLGCFMVNWSLVVHWSSVNWRLVMHGSLVVDGSFMMNWGSVVNWCFMMDGSLVLGSFVVDWSGVVSDSLMMDWSFVMDACFVMGSLMVSDSWVLSVVLLSCFLGVLVMRLLRLVLNHWDRHVLVRFSRVVLSLVISWLMVADDRLVVHWRFITLMSVLLVSHELLKERLGNFDIFDMFGGLVMRSDSLVDRSGFVMLRCCWHFHIPDLWLFVSILSTMWLLWHFNVSRSGFGVVRLLDILSRFDVMRLLHVVGLLSVSGSVHWLLNVMRLRLSIHRLAVVSLMWLRELVWHVVVAVLGGGAGFFS